MNPSERHLDGERIQGFLDERIGHEAEAAVRKHLEGCARCREEVAEWEALFATLSEMPEVAPSRDFHRRVIEAVEVPSRRGMLQSLRKLLPSLPTSTPVRHLQPEVALAYLDRALSARRGRAVASHVEGCAACRKELSRWRTVVEALEDLGHESPGPAFADAVMARVEMPKAAVRSRTTGVFEEIAARIRSLLPRSRRGWTLAGASALAPVAALTTAAVALFASHPLLTPGSLASFAWWQVTGAIRSGVGAVAQRVMASPLVLEIWQTVQGLAGDPLATGLGALAFCFTTFTALWILYRNLTTAPPVDRGYANVSA